MSSGVSQTRSIGDIIQSLKTKFRDIDYSTAVSELTAREEGLRREKGEIVARLRGKCDSLEAECAGLKTNELLLEEECRRLRRDRDVNDDKLNDLARELSLLKEKEEKANKRYGCLLNDVRVMEEDKIKSIEEKAGLRDKVEELKGILSEKEVMIEGFMSREGQINAKLEELEELRRTNARLEEEKLKHDARLEEVKREKDERIEELLNKNEAAKKLLEAELKARREELGDIRRKNDDLEEQKAKFDAQVEERRRIDREKDEQIRKLEREKNEVVKEKDGKIQDLLKDKESLNLEKRDIMAKLEEKLVKLEGDVIACMCLDLVREKRFASTQIGKILSGIIQALDSQEIGLACDAGVEIYGNTQEADSTSVSHINESKCWLKSDKQSAEDVKRTLDFKSESPREDGATGSKKTIVVIDDSDDEDENPLLVSGVNNKRKRLGNMNDQHNNDGSNDDSLNPKHKIKKLEEVHCEHVKQESSCAALSSSKDDTKFSTPQRQTLATIKRCEEKLRRDGPSSLLGDNDRKGDDSTYKGSLQIKNYVTTIRQRKQNNRLECAADMVCAFDQDDDFCAKAVCALYRRLKSRSSGKIGSDIGGSTRFEESDWERVASLAEFLIDGDPRHKLKRSVVELQGHDLKGLDDCRRFAKKYSKILIDIYKKKEDPLFRPLSNDLQYK